jgi:hypothetical protein
MFEKRKRKKAAERRFKYESSESLFRLNPLIVLSKTPMSTSKKVSPPVEPLSGADERVDLYGMGEEEAEL